MAIKERKMNKTKIEYLDKIESPCDLCGYSGVNKGCNVAEITREGCYEYGEWYLDIKKLLKYLGIS